MSISGCSVFSSLEFAFLRRKPWTTEYMVKQCTAYSMEYTVHCVGQTVKLTQGTENRNFVNLPICPREDGDPSGHPQNTSRPRTVSTITESHHSNMSLSI